MARQLKEHSHTVADRISDMPLFDSQLAPIFKAVPLRAMTTAWGHVRGESPASCRGVMWGGQAPRAVFHYTLEGAGYLRYDDRRIRIDSNRAVLVFIPSDHVYRVPKGSLSWHFAYACFTGSESLRILSAIESRMGPVFYLSSTSPTIDTLRSILHCSPSLQRDSAFELSRLAYDFAVTLLEDTMTLDRDANSPEWVERVKEYAQAHLHRAVAVSDLAEVAGYSRFHFSHMFGQIEKKSPQQYLCELRASRAKELLGSTELSVKEVASCCGYADSSYFCRQFRRHTGTSPGVYRRRIFQERSFRFNSSRVGEPPDR